MGYVRMIKAGGLHFLSNSIRFVPDLDDIPNFENLTIEEGLDGTFETIEAAKTLDLVVENLSKNFSDTTEYFEVSKNLHKYHPIIYSRVFVYADFLYAVFIRGMILEP